MGELLEALQRRGRARATSLTPLSAAVLACAAAARAVGLALFLGFGDGLDPESTPRVQ